MIRLQGTDGVRRLVMPSTAPEVAGLTPQRAYLDAGYITEQFCELYAYCRARQVMESGAAREGDTFVIGWDPRDPEGLYTGAAVRGLAKAGVNVASVGVAATPAVALYMQWIKAAGALVVTASHNPAAYNGIKIFTKRGFKLLPPDDMELSRIVMETGYEAVRATPEKGTVEDHHDQALSAFIEYSLDPLNSWIKEPSALGAVTLIVDTANGALSEAAPEVLRRAGFGEVIAVNTRLDGSVNVRSGVSELEGIGGITPDMTEAGGRFARNAAICSLFEKGRELKTAIEAGGAFVSAAVFDGDGDRFYRVDYDPFTDSAYVLTGDETAFIQATFRKSISGRKLFYNTVESDLSAATAAARTGYETGIAAVGDKWILKEAILTNSDKALDAGGESGADSFEKGLDEAGVEGCGPFDPGSMFVGAEESGHNITPGALTPSGGGEPMAVFHGNGLKSCLNTFAATADATEFASPGVRERFARLRKPFESGFKKTMYVYYVDKARWRRDSALFGEVKARIAEAAPELWPGCKAEEMVRPEEPDMLYMRLMDGKEHRASVYVRNSGTEDKTGVSLRGPAGDSAKLIALGEECWKALMVGLKDGSGAMARAEKRLIAAAASGGAPERDGEGLDEGTYDRLLNEAGLKEGLLDGGAPGALLTERGKWYLSVMETVG